MKDENTTEKPRKYTDSDIAEISMEIVSLIQPISEKEKERVLKTVCTFYGIYHGIGYGSPVEGKLNAIKEILEAILRKQ